MEKLYSNREVDARLRLATGKDVQTALARGADELKFIWNHVSEDLYLQIDDRRILLKSQQVLCCTYLHSITIGEVNEHLTLLSFNRAFYCIHTNDAEVSCNGLLFFGSSQKPILDVKDRQGQKLHFLIKELEEEFSIQDRNQEEMLRLLLKRFIICCTRLARQQLVAELMEDDSLDIVREFNVLVEEHFRQYHNVSDYAAIMHRSPKTLSNVFSRQANKKPQAVIHERLVLEAKRMLLYTSHSVKEIGLALNFEEASTFSRFFARYTGMSCSAFRKKYQKGKIANSS